MKLGLILMKCGLNEFVYLVVTHASYQKCQIVFWEIL